MYKLSQSRDVQWVCFKKDNLKELFDIFGNTIIHFFLDDI